MGLRLCDLRWNFVCQSINLRMRCVSLVKIVLTRQSFHYFYRLWLCSGSSSAIEPMTITNRMFTHFVYSSCAQDELQTKFSKYRRLKYRISVGEWPTINIFVFLRTVTVSVCIFHTAWTLEWRNCHCREFDSTFERYIGHNSIRNLCVSGQFFSNQSVLRLTTFRERRTRQTNIFIQFDCDKTQSNEISLWRSCRSDFNCQLSSDRSFDRIDLENFDHIIQSIFWKRVKYVSKASFTLQAIIVSVSIVLLPLKAIRFAASMFWGHRSSHIKQTEFHPIDIDTFDWRQLSGCQSAVFYLNWNEHSTL